MIPLVPAKAGTQSAVRFLDSRLRGNERRREPGYLLFLPRRFTPAIFSITAQTAAVSCIA
jgi:hypothetical protein